MKASEDDILQSQFPDVLEELKTNEATRDEIEAMLKEVNDLEEEEYNEEDYEVYPKAVLKEYRDKLKEINAEIKAANKEIGNLTKRIKLSGNDKALQTEKNNLEKQVQELETSRDEIEQKLATHTDYETRLRDEKDYQRDKRPQGRADYDLEKVLMKPKAYSC